MAILVREGLNPPWPSWSGRGSVLWVFGVMCAGYMGARCMGARCMGARCIDDWCMGARCYGCYGDGWGVNGGTLHNVFPI